MCEMCRGFRPITCPACQGVVIVLEEGFKSKFTPAAPREGGERVSLTDSDANKLATVLSADTLAKVRAARDAAREAQDCINRDLGSLIGE